MPVIHFNLNDEDHLKATARAIELGFSTLQSYLHSLLRSDIELLISEKLEAESLKSLQTPARKFSPAIWDEKRRRLIEQHR
jgi:hypothetical protein